MLNTVSRRQEYWQRQLTKPILSSYTNDNDFYRNERKLPCCDVHINFIWKPKGVNRMLIYANNVHMSLKSPHGVSLLQANSLTDVIISYVFWLISLYRYPIVITALFWQQLCCIKGINVDCFVFEGSMNVITWYVYMIFLPDSYIMVVITSTRAMPSVDINQQVKINSEHFMNNRGVYVLLATCSVNP